MRKRSILLLVVALTLLALAGLLHRPLLRMRSGYGLDSGEPLQDTPPLVTFTTVVLGGFRGILADVLWLRVSYLQDRHRYLELVQLADLITKLEPRCTEVWAFHAWNMAYNVSIMLPTAAERWRWVRNGIHLLRDDGLRYNPGDPRLYVEVGWLYQHKIGGFTDRAHAYYKERLAAEVTQALGGPRPDYAALAADVARRERLHAAFRLRPAHMQRIEAQYGPLDWRLAQVHAIYWAHRGLAAAGPDGYLPCTRMILQCLAELFYHGRLLPDAPPGAVPFAPDPARLAAARAAHRHAVDAFPTAGLRAAQATFLGRAVEVLHALGDEATARDVFQELHERSPSPATEAGFEAFIAGRTAARGEAP